MKNQKARWKMTIEEMDAHDRRMGPKGLSHRQMVNPRGFKGSKYGAANTGRKFTKEEIEKIESVMKLEGKL